MVVIVTYRISTRYGPKETSTLSQMVSGYSVITGFATKRVSRFLEGFVLLDSFKRPLRYFVHVLLTVYKIVSDIYNIAVKLLNLQSDQ